MQLTIISMEEVERRMPETYEGSVRERMSAMPISMLSSPWGRLLGATLIPGPPCELTLPEVLGRYPFLTLWKGLSVAGTDPAWRAMDRVETEVATPGWYLIGSRPVEGTAGVSSEDQEHCISKLGFCIPTLVELVWTIAVSFLDGDRVPLEDVYIHTSSVTGAGASVYAGMCEWSRDTGCRMSTIQIRAHVRARAWNDGRPGIGATGIRRFQLASQ